MKKYIIMGATALLAASMVSCNDFLDDNRYPVTQIVNSPLYWSSDDNVQLQVDKFYDEWVGYGNGGGLGWYYFKTLNDDQVGANFANWTYRVVEDKVSEWNSGYTTIRKINYVVENVRNSSLNEASKKNFEGIARLNRAREYYFMVRMFGDVTWEGEVMDVNSEQLYGPRTSRDVVMDSVLADINYAIAAIKTERNQTMWSRDLALALKSEICLYEGTFCLYRNVADNGLAKDEARAKKYLAECVAASEALMGKYQFTDDYQALYNSQWSASDGVTGLYGNPEVIFMKGYNVDQFRNSLISYTASSTTMSGYSKDAFDSYLFLDGKPLALTSMDRSDAGVAEGDNACYIGDLLKRRDKRMQVSFDPYIYYQGMVWSRAGTTGMASSSGYGVAKYDNVNMPLNNRQNSANNYSCCPLYWISYIYLNFAEAKAELDGTLSQADFARSIGHLYERAGLPITQVSQLINMNDPANNMGVSSLLWEIRRCRRNELILDNWIRYWDLVRWHQLELLDTQKHPNVILGANITNAPVKITAVNNYVDGSMGQSRIYESKYYLYPIPASQNALTNGALGQNPGWK